MRCTQHRQYYDVPMSCTTEMYLLATFLLLASAGLVRLDEQTEHRDFQYNSVVDPITGRYNFAYDTGNDNDIAHAMHMQYRDANGIVRGRYGYTDPNGKLRMVEYEAGPDGFVARGDVGPDSFPHDQAPVQTQVPQTSARYVQDDDLDLDPRPVQMAGWDPSQDPMGRPVSDVGPTSAAGVVGSSGQGEYSTVNATDSNKGEAYAPKAGAFDDRYPRIDFSTNENIAGREVESGNSQTGGDENKPKNSEEIYPVASPLNINNIDVNPGDIRVAASGQATTARSADGDASRSPRNLPYSYRNYRRQTHDHDGEIARLYRSVYIPSHGHYHYVKQNHDHEAEKRSNRYTHDHDAERRYYVANRQTHDHDAERRYASNRQTHDHDAERRYYVSNRQTHDHDAEKRYASNRQTHDHDAERRYYVANRQTHDQDAERRYYAYLRAQGVDDQVAHTIYHQNNPNRRRIYYRDSHSMVPHEHYSDIYHNDRSHQHSDVHLYGRPQNYARS